MMMQKLGPASKNVIGAITSTFSMFNMLVAVTKLQKIKNAELEGTADAFMWDDLSGSILSTIDCGSGKN